MRSFFAQSTLSLVAALALLAASCFGTGLSFLCVCAGITVETALDHCHGPSHGAECLQAHAEDTCAPGEEREAGDKEHVALRKELKLSSPAKAISAPEQIGMAVAFLPWLARRDTQVVPLFSIRGFRRTLDPPPLAERYSRTVSLVI